MICPFCKAEMVPNEYTSKFTVPEGLPSDASKEEWFMHQSGWRCEACASKIVRDEFPNKLAYWIFHDSDGMFFWLQTDDRSGHWCKFTETKSRKGKLIGVYPIQ